MKNIHLIPTSQPSNITIQKRTDKLCYDVEPFTHDKYDVISNQHIYITSNEEIKYGDWYIFPIHKNGFAIKLYNSVKHFSKEPCISLGNLKAKKIILTTDQDLIKDGVQAIDDEFLEWFVNNPSCEEVEVNYQTIGLKNGVWQYHYQIIIPKEKQKQHLIDMMRYDEELGLYEKLKQDWFCPKCDSYVSSESVTFDETHQTCNTGVVIKEPKQETLEEAANKYSNKIMDDGESYHGFKTGAKWEAERMYTEEDLRQAYNYGMFAVTSGRNFKDWFTNYKKK